ncbi:MAG: YdcH family protein [Acidobacteria bacterium]|nr:YdcH family protein [Acidobacteriota bacterium]
MDVNTQNELKAHLMATNDNFRRLAEQHAQYKRRVEELEAKHALSEQEKLEESRLKKLKLHVKDQMAQMISHYRAQHVR